MKKTLPLAVLAVLCAGAGLEALAQTNPNQLIAQRKGAMNLQAKYAGPLFAMARGAAPFDAKVAQRNADYLVVLSQLPWDDFQPSTAANPNTRTKESAYIDDKFKQLAETLQSDVKKLAAAVRAGDEAAVKTAARAMGKTCNTCHENFATFEFRFRVE